jgi:RIO-like serine/threonine protein kinase
MLEDIPIEFAETEIELQQIASKYDFVPKIINTEFTDEKCIITMENIEGVNLADKYGDKSEDIPENIWVQIRNALTILLEEEGIEYVDITPYNFIEKDGKIYVIDFGDAFYTDLIDINPFLNDFIYNGLNEWNEEFA